MHLTILDWFVIGGYGLLALAVGLWFARRAGRSTEEFFLGGRSLPWWVVGTSMVATTFAADTPLAVTEFVRTDGIWGNWFWWTWAVAHVLAIFLFSRLWRRAKVITDAQLIELRYAGKPAAALRAIKACLMAVVFNVLVLAWVTQAMATILRGTVDIPENWALAICGVLAVAYSITAGFWGVVVTDLFQFVVAMVGSVAFAAFAVHHAGGMDAMMTTLERTRAATVDTVPSLSSDDPRSLKFLVFITVAWWATHNADAGGYMMQRMSAAKNERHAMAGAMWFTVAQYALRVWPWILVALASVVILPPETFTEHKSAYPRLMAMILPAGLKGLVLVSLLAAFMSTVDTHLNWGASYLVCDIYQRFVRPDASQRRLVWAGRLASLILAGTAVLAGMFIVSIKGAWAVLYSLGAGMGPILILRWFWWRINAWSELSALSSSVLAGTILSAVKWPYHFRLLAVAGFSLAVSLITTLLTRPESADRLVSFHRRVRPGGFWGPIADQAGDTGPVVLKPGVLIDVLLGLVSVYGCTLGLGYVLMGRWLWATLLLVPAALCVALLAMRYRKS